MLPAHLYVEKFRERYRSPRESFLQRGRKNGNIRPRPGQNGGAVTYAHIVNSRSLAQALGYLTTSTIWRTLKHNPLHPHQVQRVQALLIW